MDRINGKDWVDIGSGRRGFKDQDAVKGIRGTELLAEWLNGLQEEILKVIEGAGLKPDAKDWSQLSAAIGKVGLPPFAWNINWMAVKSTETSIPPDNAAEGDVYLIPTAAAGAWADKTGQLALKQNSGWLYARPKDGHGFGLPNGDIYVRKNGEYIKKEIKAVGFSAVGLKDITTIPSDVLTNSNIGKEIIFDSENNFNTQKSVYKAPYDGQYLIMGNFFFMDIPERIHLYIVVDGNIVAETAANYRGRVLSVSASLKVQAGQEISLMVRQVSGQPMLIDRHYVDYKFTHQFSGIYVGG